METTCDWILGHRVQLEQPRKGFRVAMDTVLLAAAVRAEAGQSALDMGCGVGGAMLCLVARVAGIKALGIDIQPELVELCRLNIERNGVINSISVMQADLCATPFLSASFDHVMMNPPYHEANKHDLSPNQSKSRANAEQGGELAQWLAFADSALKPEGQLTLIHRADRLEDILAQASSAGFYCGEIIRILPHDNEPPSRVILRLKQYAKPKPAEEGRRLILHGRDGGYTLEAEEILREAKSL